MRDGAVAGLGGVVGGPLRGGPAALLPLERGGRVGRRPLGLGQLVGELLDPFLQLGLPGGELVGLPAVLVQCCRGVVGGRGGLLGGRPRGGELALPLLLRGPPALLLLAGPAVGGGLPAGFSFSAPLVAVVAAFPAGAAGRSALGAGWTRRRSGFATVVPRPL